MCGKGVVRRGGFGRYHGFCPRARFNTCWRGLGANRETVHHNNRLHRTCKVSRDGGEQCGFGAWGHLLC